MLKKKLFFFWAFKVVINIYVALNQETATKVNLPALAYNYCKLKPGKSNLLDVSEIKKVIKKLKIDENIIISKPDKGNNCVILNKSD